MSAGSRTVSNGWSAAIVAISLFGVMAWTIVQLDLPTEPGMPVSGDSLPLLGAALVDPGGYLLPFEGCLSGVLLTVVLIGALFLGRR